MADANTDADAGNGSSAASTRLAMPVDRNEDRDRGTQDQAQVRASGAVSDNVGASGNVEFEPEGRVDVTNTDADANADTETSGNKKVKSTSTSKPKQPKQGSKSSKSSKSNTVASASSTVTPTSTNAISGSITLTPLGTASAQPSLTRNHSALALTLEGRTGGEVWMFDCGEGTQGRVMMSGGGDGKVKVRMGKIGKVFLTHMHGDHVFGLAPLLSTAMNGAGGVMEDPEMGIVDERLRETDADVDLPTIEIYGPLHTRAFLRSAFTYTYTHLSGRYVVHELRFAHEPTDDTCALPLHASELPSGRNITQESDGTWRGVYEDEGVRVDAAPIVHSVPCVGYVVTEADVPMSIDAKVLVPLVKKSGAPMSVLGLVQRGEDVTLPDGTVLKGVGKRPGRKVVILGDTCDAGGACPALVDMARGADVLVHEATNAYLPDVPLPLGGSKGKIGENAQSVRDRTSSRGHSTPEMAGTFARRVGAKMVLLNHFSARYAGGADAESGAVMDAIRGLAVDAFGSERVVCARDLESVVITR